MQKQTKYAIIQNSIPVKRDNNLFIRPAACASAYGKDYRGTHMEQYQDFNGTPLSPEMYKALTAIGFTTLTEVQSKSIPILREGKDLVAKAPTGTGKTFAFGIPLVERIDRESDEVQALILAPTRELASQINSELGRLTAFTAGVRTVVLYGGQPINTQIMKLKKRPQIVVATPGRLLDHISRHTVKLSRVRMAVLDEADEMLDMGFFKDVSKILDKLPQDKQLAMFSATITREVMDIMWLYQKEAEEITVTPVAANAPKITQYALRASSPEKMALLKKLITIHDYRRIMVFCNTKRMTERLVGELKRCKFDAEGLSSDVNQQTRNKIMDRFRKHNLRILVCTDVAARGIDVEDVDAVFNYDVPQDNPYYLHRIGRTGRAQREGVAYVFYDVTEFGKLKEIIRYTHSDIKPAKLGENGLEQLEQF